MSRIWYFFILLGIVLIVWIVVNNDNSNGNGNGNETDPPATQTVGFDSIQVNSRLISQIFGVTDSVRGFRVYNAFTDGRNAVGLVFAALDSNSSEIFDDGRSFYIPINSEGIIMEGITRDEAKNMIMPLVEDRNYRHFISSFYAKSLNEFWRQGVPDLIWLVPSMYEHTRDSIYQNIDVNYTDPSDMTGKKLISIKGRPCPNFCPENADFIYEPNRHPLDSHSPNDHDNDDDDDDDNGNERY
ncbi:MAG: hypothetical protein EA362_10700 [Saprospirales bacterium]|nr:MAG: hypothetical protein EA362_10700 [Saprospirales bacterium]